MLHRLLNDLGWTIGILAVASVAFYLTTEKNKFLPGTDAYYYALQADTWARTGDVKIPDPSPIHRITGLLQRSGFSTETAVRLWLTFSLCFSGFLLLALLSGKDWWNERWLVTSWFLMSPSILFNALEFPKLFTAVAFFPLCLFLVRPGSRYAWLGIGLSWGLGLLHRAMTPMAFLLTLSVLYRDYAIAKRAVILLWLIGLSAVATILRWRTLFQELQLTGTDWRLGLISLMSRASLPIAIKFEIVMCWALLIYVLFWRTSQQRHRKATMGLCVLSLVPLIIPNPTTEVLGMGERIALLAPWIHMSLAAFLLSLAPPIPIDRNRSTDYRWARVIVALTFVGMTPFRYLYSHPIELDPAWPKYEKLVQALASRDIPMLIAHRGLNFYYKFRLRREAFGYEPELHWDKTRVWRLAWGITADEFQYGLPKECQWGKDVQALPEKDYQLVREDCWVKFRSGVDAKRDPELYARVWKAWQNPSSKRPARLYGKHRADSSSEFSAIAGGG